MENGIHFISGLPRSGSTLLAALLRQSAFLGRYDKPGLQPVQRHADGHERPQPNREYLLVTHNASGCCGLASRPTMRRFTTRNWCLTRTGDGRPNCRL